MKKKFNIMKIENTFWFRHFLMCSKVANLMMSPRGWHVDNFALSFIESENGRFGNDQMNIYFTMADIFFADLHSSYPESVFEFLADEGVSMENLAKLSLKEIEDYYNEYCAGRIDFSNLIEP
jgi:hypothetical protein